MCNCNEQFKYKLNYNLIDATTFQSVAARSISLRLSKFVVGLYTCLNYKLVSSAWLGQDDHQERPSVHQIHL